MVMGKNNNGLLTYLNNRIFTICLNRPKNYNTLTFEILETLIDIFKTISENSKIDVVIIKNIGKAFSTGHDLKEIKRQNNQNYLNELFETCSRMMQIIQELPQPVIAQISGITTAAGCQLVATADLALATTESTFATNGINNGLFCATPAVALSRNVGRKKALEMLLTGDFIDANQAANIGLINHVYEQNQIEEKTISLAQKIADKSSFAVKLGKKSFYAQLELGIEDAYQQTSRDLVCNILSEDGQEGLEAFIEKRTPKWRKK